MSSTDTTSTSLRMAKSRACSELGINNTVQWYSSVQAIEDTKIPNAATIKVLKQARQHAAGVRRILFIHPSHLCVFLVGVLNSQLLAMPQILFAGYKVPHPLHPYFLIKIQTDGSITPQALLDEAGEKLIRTLVSLESKFKREFSYKDVEGTVGASVVSGTMMTTATAMATTTTTTTISHLD